LVQIYGTVRTSLDLTGAQEYTVVSGDTLTHITRRFYGTLTNVGNAGAQNGFYFPIIMAASNHQIVDPDLIEPGMRLLIPDLQRNLNNQNSRRAIQQALRDVALLYVQKGHNETSDGLNRLANSL